MPRYQYACRSCEHSFEAVQGFHEDSLTTCPECSAVDLRKLFGNVGVVFKGSGFYRTDSRSERRSGASGEAKPKSESKPEPKESPGTEKSSPKAGSDASGSSSEKPAAKAASPALT